MSFLKDNKFDCDNLTSGELRSYRSHNFLVEFIEVREKEQDLVLNLEKGKIHLHEEAQLSG